MAYKHKIRLSHILDDLDRGYIKTRDELKAVLDQLDKDTFIDHFLDEFEQNKETGIESKDDEF